MGPFLWRLLNADYDEVTARSFWNDVRSGEVAFLPSVWFFGQLSIRIIDVNGNLCPIDFRSQPEPIFVPFEQLLPHRLFFSRTQVASPVILTHLKSFFDIWFGGLKSKRLRVIHRRENHGLQCDQSEQRKARAEYYFCEPFHRVPQSLVTMP